jgi:NAD-dependent dihydropyrimidine dehydrogenase PreA subunit
MISHIDQAKCTGCYVCVEVCGKDVLRFDTKTKKAYIQYHADCQTCYNCEIHCPSDAVFVDPMHRKKVLPW